LQKKSSTQYRINTLRGLWRTGGMGAYLPYTEQKKTIEFTYRKAILRIKRLFDYLFQLLI